MNACHNGTSRHPETSENLFVDDFFRRQQACAEGHASSYGDNRDQLFKRFRLRLDPSHQRYVTGYQWFCRVCENPSASEEVWFPCRQKFVTVKVVCHLGCHNHWRLKIHAHKPMSLASVC
ncbi:hypothetical protein [Desulfosoma caldarium]|uniref:Uncharacterized protein n=1 Tax=Desulfosoma caldarium TaxID=610254 RepID=A0A3N1UQ85_9BACT|nr:hypothetical protein [Desulfosoma caldarium]ROQ93285.1 hypothetical protein EDC27_1297 [Desulfosoma caldarium]